MNLNFCKFIYDLVLPNSCEFSCGLGGFVKAQSSWGAAAVADLDPSHSSAPFPDALSRYFFAM